MNGPKKIKASENKADAHDDRDVTLSLALDTPSNLDTFQPQEPRPEQTWLEEIGWRSPLRARDAGQVDQGYRAAPMHRRGSYGDNAQREGKLAVKSALPRAPQQNRQHTKPSLQHGSGKTIAIGATVTLLFTISFITVYDITSGGGFRKTLASSWSLASPAADSETTPLVETKLVVIEPQPLAVSEPVQDADTEIYLNDVAPVTKTVDVASATPEKITQGSVPASEEVISEPLPVEVAPPSEVKPELTDSVVPESPVSEEAIPEPLPVEVTPPSEVKPELTVSRVTESPDPIQDADTEAALNEVAPVTKTVDVASATPEKITQGSVPASEEVISEPLPVEVAPPSEVKPELTDSVVPESPVSEEAIPEPLPVEVTPPSEVKPELTDSVVPESPEPVASDSEESTEIAPASPPALQKFSSVERDVFQDCDNCPVMVVVQSGSFQMGAAEDDGTSQPYELPVHKVSITKPFAIGRFEVTAKDWEQCVADNGCQPLPLNEGWNAPRQPAIQVSWNDIKQQYLPWLSQVTGKPYRLPTEAEWEYAAKGGSAAGSSEAQAFGSLAKTIAVGSFEPNSLGLYDMSGNVWEWVEDCWNANYTLTPVDGSAAASGDCSLRVARGGSWASSTSLRSTKRGWNKPDTQNNTLGFRVARSL